MTVPLDKPIRRQVEINGELHTLTLDADGVTIVRKGARKGFSVTWASLVEGSPQMQLDLMRSIQAAQQSHDIPPAAARRPAKKRAASRDLTAPGA